MSVCPNKNSNEWKELLKLVGGDTTAAMSIFIASGYQLLPIKSVTQVKKELSFRGTNLSELSVALLNKRIKKYNNENNTTHRVVYTTTSPTTSNAKFHYNLTPKVNSNYIIDDRTTKKVSESDDVVYEVTLSPDDVIQVKEGNEYIVGGEIYPSMDDAKNSLFHQLVTVGNKEEPASQLDIFLTEYMNKFGISVQQVSDFKQRFDIDGKGLADMVNKIIYVAKGQATIDTLPHEASHFIVEMLGENHPLYKSMLSVIENTQEYKDVLKEYFQLYEGDIDKLKKEAIGQVLAKHILKSYEDTKVKSILDRIITWFKNIFKSFSPKTIQDEVDRIYSGVAKKILNNELELNTNNINKESGVLYSLNEYNKKLHEAIDKIDARIKVLEKSLSFGESSNRVDTMKLASGMLRDTMTLSGNNTKDMLNAKKGVGMFFSYMIKNEFPELIRAMELYNNGKGEIPSANEIANIESTLNLYKSILDDIVSSRRDNEVGSILDDFIDEKSAIESTIADLSRFVSYAGKDRAKIIVDSIKNKNSQYSAEELTNSKVGDLGFVSRFIYPLHAASDEILRMVYKVVSDIHNKAYRMAVDDGKRLLRAQEKLNRAGIKDLSIFKEKDEFGNPTGFLISGENWGIYNRELAKTQDKIAKALGFENYDDIQYNELTRDQKIILTKEWRVFSNTYKKFGPNGDVVANPPRNEEFYKLMKSNPAIKEYYDIVLEINNKTKELLPRRYSRDNYKFLLPQMRKDIIQALKESKDSLAVTLKKKALEGIIVQSDEKGYGDKSGDVLIDANKNVIATVPIYFTQKLDNMNDLSNDITSMYAHFSEMSHNYSGITEKLGELKLIQKMVGERKVYKTAEAKEKDKGAIDGKESKAYEVLTNFLNANVYGQEEAQVKVNVRGKEINLSKVMKKGIEYIRAKNLFANFTSMLSGGIKANIDSLMEDVIGEFTTPESKAWATLEFTKNLPYMTVKAFAKNKNNKLMFLLERNGVLDDIATIFRRLDMNNRLARISSSDVVYGGFEMIDTQVKSIYVLAVYDNYRLVNGKFITKADFLRANKDKSKHDLNREWSSYRDKSLWNAYEKTDTNIKVKPEFEKYVTDELENTVQGIVKNRTHTIEGSLNSMDRSSFSRTISGQLVMMHRSWIIQGITERFKPGGINYITGLYEKGYYRTFFGLIGKTLTFDKKNVRERLAVWNNLSPYEKVNTYRMLFDMAATLALMILFNIINNLAEDGDEDDWWLQFLAYLSTRAFLEQAAFMNPSEIPSMINSPTPAMSTFDQFGALFNSVFNNEEIESGAFEGYTHREKALIGLSFGNNIIKLQDPKSQNKYVKSMIIGYTNNKEEEEE